MHFDDDDKRGVRVARDEVEPWMEDFLGTEKRGGLDVRGEEEEDW